MNEIGPNFIARPYRGVSVQDVATLEDDALLAHVRARRVYRRTEFIVATCGDEPIHADGIDPLIEQRERAEHDLPLLPIGEIDPAFLDTPLAHREQAAIVIGDKRTLLLARQQAHGVRDPIKQVI